MRCGALTPTDCAADHWCQQLGGRKEPAGWRAPCPVCRTLRALEYDARPTAVRWQVWCPCERDTVRKALADLLPQCMPGRRDKAISPAEIRALVLADIPPKTKYLRLLELTGIPTGEALTMLGVRQSNRGRTIAGRSGAASKRMQNPRKAPHPNG